MIITTNTKELLTPLLKLQGAIASNPVLPILENFLFEIGGGKLKISATDLEVWMTMEIPLMTDGELKVAIPAKIIVDTLKAYPNQPLKMDFSEEGKCKLKANRSKKSFAVEIGEDFPQRPQSDGENSIMDGEVLLTHLTKCAPFVSTDSLRPSLCGVHFALNGSMKTVATDAHQLSLVESEYEGIETNFILPIKGVKLLQNNLKGVEVSFTKTRSHAIFENGGMFMAIQLVDARFPDYNAVIPEDNPIVAKLSKHDLTGALKRTLTYCNKTTNQGIFHFSEGELKITAQDLDFSNESEEIISCECNEELRIGFNVKFAIKELDSMEEDEVFLNMSTPSRAAILTNGNEGDIRLLMPVMLSN